MATEENIPALEDPHVEPTKQTGSNEIVNTMNEVPPPPAVDVTTHTKRTPEDPTKNSLPSPKTTLTPTTPKTPTTQEGIRYRALYN